MVTEDSLIHISSEELQHQGLSHLFFTFFSQIERMLIHSIKNTNRYRYNLEMKRRNRNSGASVVCVFVHGGEKEYKSRGKYREIHFSGVLSGFVKAS